MELEKLFCEIDDFCVTFEEAFKSQVITHEKQQRQRRSQLCLSEIMTIIVYFHHSNYRNFKSYYQEKMIEHYQKEFPCLVSYNRFVELMSINFGFWILDFRLGKKNRRLWRGVASSSR